jgi:hypothetical protein
VAHGPLVLSLRAITLCNKNGSKLNLNLICYLGKAKQCTKYQINICKMQTERKKCGKLNNS